MEWSGLSVLVDLCQDRVVIDLHHAGSPSVPS